MELMDYDHFYRKKEENEYPIYSYIHLFFIFTGFISYIFAFVISYLYLKNLSFVINRIFTFLFLSTLKSLLKLVLETTLKKEIIIYCIGVVEFYLLLTYLNRSFTSKKISQNTSSYAINYLFFILLAYTTVSFPFIKAFNLSKKYAFLYNIINILYIFLLYRYINIKLRLLLEYLKDNIKADSSIPNLYLQYTKAHFYYTNFNNVNILFFIICILSICYHTIKILDLLLNWHNFSIYLIIIIPKIIDCCLLISFFLLFFNFNKNKIIKKGKKRKATGEEGNLSKFSVVDVDIQQDENTNLSERKRNKNKEKEEENNEEDSKEKTHLKISEESETLK